MLEGNRKAVRSIWDSFDLQGVEIVSKLYLCAANGIPTHHLIENQHVGGNHANRRMMYRDAPRLLW